MLVVSEHVAGGEGEGGRTLPKFLLPVVLSYEDVLIIVQYSSMDGFHYNFTISSFSYKA